jgi:hypothetical protein
MRKISKYIKLLLLAIGLSFILAGMYFDGKNKPLQKYEIASIASPIFGESPAIEGLVMSVYRDKIIVGTPNGGYDVNKTFEIDSVEENSVSGYDVKYYFVQQTEGSPLREGSLSFIIGIEDVEDPEFSVFFKDQGRNIMFILMFKTDKQELGLKIAEKKDNGLVIYIN